MRQNRLLIFILVFVLVATTGFSGAVLAEDERWTFTLDEVQVQPGETVWMNLRLTHATDLMAFVAVLDYDRDVLRLVDDGIVMDDEVARRFTVTVNADINQNGTIGFAAVSTQAYDPDEEPLSIAKIGFQALEGAPEGRCSVRFREASVSAMLGETATDIPVEMVDGAVIVGASAAENPPAGTDAPPTEPPVPDFPETSEPSVEPPVFSDMDQAPWAEEYVTRLAADGIVSGTGAGQFEPNRSITREEFTKIIIAAFHLEDDTAACDFSDVSTSDWYYLYIASALKYGIINGVGDGTFGVGNNITRQDMAVIAHRAAVSQGIALPSGGEAERFADQELIADYAVDSVGVMQSAGILSGMGDNRFEPTGTATRAQAAKVIYMLLYEN